MAETTIHDPTPSLELGTGTPDRPALATQYPPLFREDQRAPLSMDLDGNLRVAGSLSQINPQTGAALDVANFYRTVELILRELRINNLLLLRLTEPYGANFDIRLTEPDGATGAN